MTNMPKVKTIEIDEKKLERLLLDDPEVIEEGMKILGHQVRTDSGPLDMLGSDSDNVLTVIELKTSIDDTQLDQGLRYYDWALSNIEGLSRNYPEKIDVYQQPRLVLIAPRFSDNLKRIVKYVNVNIDLKEYHALELPTSEKAVICTSIRIEKPSGPTEIPKIENHLKIIEREKIRSFCEKCLKELENKEIKLQALSDGWISAWYRNKRFMYIGCKKKFFVCQIERIDGSWSNRIRITNYDDWEKAMKEEIEPVLRGLEST